MGARAERLVIINGSVRCRILNERAEDAVRKLECSGIADVNFDAERQCTRLNNGDYLGMTFIGNKKYAPFGTVLDAEAHGHSFGGGGGFIEQRRIGDFHAGEIDDHCLKIEERLEAALSDFRLIGSVLRVPSRILENISANDTGGNRIGIAGAKERAIDAILRSHILKAGERFFFS